MIYVQCIATQSVWAARWWKTGATAAAPSWPENRGMPPGASLSAWLRGAARSLESIGSGREARHLLRETLGLSAASLSAQLHVDLKTTERAALDARLRQRLTRVPLSQVLGSQPFWTLDLAVSPDVLTPRADSEAVVAAVVEATGGACADADADADARAGARVLDIGSGSGCLLLATLSELPGATGLGTDASAAALDVARANAVRCGLKARASFVETSWADGVSGQWDVVVSNPPYIPTASIKGLEPEVRDHEPRMALDGGSDGLAYYPHVLAEAARLLAPGGVGVFEHGFDQGPAVRELARAHFGDVAQRHDRRGVERCVRVIVHK